MADRNLRLNVKTPDGYDTFYPQTTGSNVLLRGYKKSDVPQEVSADDSAMSAIEKIEYRVGEAITKDHISDKTGDSEELIMSQKAVTEAMVAGGLGDMLKSIYDSNSDGVVNSADKAAEAQHAAASDESTHAISADKLANKEASHYLTQEDYDVIRKNNSNLQDIIFIGPANYGTVEPSDAPKGRLFFLIEKKE